LKLYEGKIRLIVKCFAADLAARFRRLDYAVLTARIYRVLQERIFETFETQRPVFAIVEVDGSFFGVRRIKGKCSASGKISVFVIFERVYTEIVPGCSKPMLQGIIRGR